MRGKIIDDTYLIKYELKNSHYQIQLNIFNLLIMKYEKHSEVLN